MTNIKVPEDRRLTGVLAGSLKALKRNPVLFAPKLASTFLGALVFVAILDSVKTSQLSLALLPVIFLSFVFVLFTGLLASVLVSSMVGYKDELNGNSLLKKGLSESRSKVSDVAISVALLTGFIILTYTVFGVGFAAYYLSGSIAVLVFTAIIVTLLIIASSFYLFFLPVAIFEKESWKSAFKASSTVSSRNSRDVSLLMVFSLLMLAPALYFTGELEKAGYIGFILSRLVSGVVNTYVFTLSPEYYLSAQGLD